MWSLHSVSLKLASPLHVGKGFRGNLKHTRAYVGGRALWGALACRIARDYLKGHYRDAENWVHNNLRFSYLYPSAGEGQPPSFPWAADASHFRWQFLHSYASTALVDGRSKLDGSLHETEYIAPRTRDNQQVWLRGYLWARTDALLNGQPLQDLWVRLFSSINLGAERSYGWGRISAACFTAMPANTPVFSDWLWKQDTHDEVLLDPSPVSTGSACLYAHMDVGESQLLGAPIELEPLVGLLTDSTGWGRRPSDVVIAAPPGATLTPPRKCIIGNFGVWRTLQP